MKKNKGMVYVFEGDGKGKTSAALGVALRSLLTDKRVVWISWFKEPSWKVSEMKLTSVFEKSLEMHWMGRGFYGGLNDHDTPKVHKGAAEEAFRLAKKILTEKDRKKGSVFLLVLDEAIRAINDGLITIDDILEVVKLRGETHLVLTGHDCPAKLMRAADLVTEMKNIKHPYDKKILAVQGLDF